MPIAIILALLKALPALVPGIEGLVQAITAGVAQRGHFTPEQVNMISQLTDTLNDQAAALEKQRLSPPS